MTSSNLAAGMPSRKLDAMQGLRFLCEQPSGQVFDVQEHNEQND